MKLLPFNFSVASRRYLTGLLMGALGAGVQAGVSFLQGGSFTLSGLIHAVGLGIFVAIGIDLKEWAASSVPSPKETA